MSFLQVNREFKSVTYMESYFRIQKLHTIYILSKEEESAGVCK